MPPLSFWDDFWDYMEHGFVACRPRLFAMVKVMNRDGRQGWFIRYAVGPIEELISCIPFPLEFVAFCRDNDHILRICRWDVFVRSSLRKAK